jgi:hypothetical protein
MIERRGLEHVGFVTLTFAENLTDRTEAQRRFNSLATSFFRRVDGLEWIAAVERQGRGAIHYHLVMAFPWDIRTGFDFGACRRAGLLKRSGLPGWQDLERTYFRSANEALRGWWADLRAAAPRYGFGRCETLPVLTSSEQIARYVGSYVGKEFVSRLSQDKGLRTIRYSLAVRPWAYRWSYLGGGQARWRLGCKLLASMIGTEDFARYLGKRWAWSWRVQIRAFGRLPGQAASFLPQFVDLETLSERCSWAISLGLHLDSISA